MRWYYIALIAGMAAVTYATRVGFIGVARQFDLHPLLRRSLEYVPVSILAALVFPAILAPTGKMVSPIANVYVWSALITAGVLFATRKQWLAIIMGVASLVLLRHLLGV
jgi:branched-subunit amino acid transport protein